MYICMYLSGYQMALTFVSSSRSSFFIISHCIINNYNNIKPLILPLNAPSPSLSSSMSLPQNPKITTTATRRRRRSSLAGPTHSLSRRGGGINPNNFTVRALDNEEASTAEVSSSSTRLIILSAAAAAAAVLAVANRVLYKLALVPMKQYPFFMAQLNTFGYVVIYFSILYMRYRLGIVTDEMLAIPKSKFVIIGILEALGVAAGMSSGAMLPGPAIPILNQAFLVWQLSFAILLLGRKYTWNKISGCLLVAGGVVIAVASGSESGQMLSGIDLVWPALMITSTAFQAGASILKESVFLDAANRFKGKLLDIFVVNSFGSGFQALFVLLFLPFLSNLKGIPFSQLGTYLKSGAGCFLNIGTQSLGCDGAPMLPLLYIATNIAFNISLLNLLKISSAVVCSLVVMSTVPISIYILSLPLPYLPGGATLSQSFLLGSMILVIGLILYNIPLRLKEESQIL